MTRTECVILHTDNVCCCLLSRIIEDIIGEDTNEEKKMCLYNDILELVTEWRHLHSVDWELNYFLKIMVPTPP